VVTRFAQRCGGGGVMRKFIESKKATVVTRALAGAGGLTVLVAVLAAGVKWT
jgi:hypothetical protein